MVTTEPITDKDQSAKLQVLSTEHWSLLATRSLTYGESFSRAGMFLTVLTGAVVSLALLAQAGHVGRSFTLAALLILSVVFFLGLATLGRLRTIDRQDMRWVAGMNRLRRAYLEMYPDLETYFVTDSHDDIRGVVVSAGYAAGRFPGEGRMADLLHGFTTLPAVIGIIVAVIAGVLEALIANALVAPEEVAIGIGVAVFIATMVILGFQGSRAFFAYIKTMQTRFPSTKPGPYPLSGS